MEQNILQKKIMRRIYYAYTLSFALHSMFWRGIFLGAAAVLLADWLHVASIAHNFLSASVAQVPTYVGNTFIHAATQGELLTVVVFVAAFLITLSSLRQLARYFHSHASATQVA